MFFCSNEMDVLGYIDVLLGGVLRIRQINLFSIGDLICLDFLNRSNGNYKGFV